MDAASNLMHVMSLAPGVRLGPYEIVALIGAGGMGKFYAVRIPESGPAPDIAPEFLFDMHANVSNTRNSYVPRADGQRFLVNMVLDKEDAPINVISNWPAGIK